MVRIKSVTDPFERIKKKNKNLKRLQVISLLLAGVLYKYIFNFSFKKYKARSAAWVWKMSLDVLLVLFILGIVLIQNQ